MTKRRTATSVVAMVDRKEPPTGEQSQHLNGTANNSRNCSEVFNRFFNNLYQRYWHDLCSLLRSRFGDGPPDPEDIAQQAYTRIAMLEGSEQLENPKGYLYRIAINLGIDYRRQIQRHRQLMQNVVMVSESDLFGVLRSDQGGSTLENQISSREALEIIEQVIMSHSERDRNCFLLNRLEGVSAAEIARRTGLSASRVKVVIINVMVACQQALRAAQGEKDKQ